MSVRRVFGESILRETLESIAKNLKEVIEIYLIGGGAMMFYELKPATKDIDIVFKNRKDLEAFIVASKKAGIVHAGSIGKEYENMGTTIILRAPSGIQLDLFNRVVCNALELTQGVKERATHHADMGKLHIHLMSREDIALFKSITEREADLDDIRTLAEAGLDWTLVEDECLKQKKPGYWAQFILVKMADLKDKHGIDINLPKIKELADSYILQKTFKEILGENEMEFNDIYEIIHDKTGYSKTWTRNRLKELEAEKIISSRKSGRTRAYRLVSQSNTL